MSKHLEDSEQKALMQWANTKKVRVYEKSMKLSDFLFSIPNGGNRNAREAARLKATGVKSGVSDLFLPIPRNGNHGLWIEMKKPRKAYKYPSQIKGAMTDNQKQWFNYMAMLGYETALCFGFEDAKIAIENYLDKGFIKNEH